MCDIMDEGREEEGGGQQGEVEGHLFKKSSKLREHGANCKKSNLFWLTNKQPVVKLEFTRPGVT